MVLSSVSAYRFWLSLIIVVASIDSGGDWYVMSGVRVARRRSVEIVDVHRRSLHVDPVRHERPAQRRHEVQRRVVHRRGLRERPRPQRQQAPHFESRTCPGTDAATTAAVEPAAARRDAGCSREAAVVGRHRDAAFAPTDAPGARLSCTEPSLNWSALTLAEKLAGHVVPRPARPEAVVVERVVVADDTAVDPDDARRLQLRGPVGEQQRGLAVPVVDARIAGADDDEVAVKTAVVDRPRGEKPRRVGVVPARASRRRPPASRPSSSTPASSACRR